MLYTYIFFLYLIYIYSNMGHLHNLKNQNTSFLSSFGEKVKHVAAAAAATAKGIYDTGRTI